MAEKKPPTTFKKMAQFFFVLQMVILICSPRGACREVHGTRVCQKLLWVGVWAGGWWKPAASKYMQRYGTETEAAWEGKTARMLPEGFYFQCDVRCMHMDCIFSVLGLVCRWQNELLPSNQKRFGMIEQILSLPARFCTTTGFICSWESENKRVLKCMRNLETLVCCTWEQVCV